MDERKMFSSQALKRKAKCVQLLANYKFLK